MVVECGKNLRNIKGVVTATLEKITDHITVGEES